MKGKPSSYNQMLEIVAEVDHPDLNEGHRRLLSDIAYDASSDGRGSRPGLEKLAKRGRCSTETIRKRYQHCIQVGVLRLAERSRGEGYAHVFDLALEHDAFPTLEFKPVSSPRQRLGCSKPSSPNVDREQPKVTTLAAQPSTVSSPTFEPSSPRQRLGLSYTSSYTSIQRSTSTTTTPTEEPATAKPPVAVQGEGGSGSGNCSLFPSSNQTIRQEPRWWFDKVWRQGTSSDITVVYKARPEEVAQSEILIREHGEIIIAIAWAGYVREATMYNNETLYPMHRFLKNFDAYHRGGDEAHRRALEFGVENARTMCDDFKLWSHTRMAYPDQPKLGIAVEKPVPSRK